MTAITATERPGGPQAPAGIQLDISGAPLPPTTVYVSNFTGGTDGWSGSGLGVGLSNDTTLTPDALRLAGMSGSSGAVSAARNITGLTVGFTYRFGAWLDTVLGQTQMTVRETGGTQVAATSWFGTLGRSYFEVSFTATATTMVAEIFAKNVPAQPKRATLNVDTVRVDPDAMPAVYTSNFTASADGWAASGTGANPALWNGTDPWIWLHGAATGTVGNVITAAKTITGLVVGTRYQMRATLTRNDPWGGTTRLRVNTGDGTVYSAVPVGSNVDLLLPFTATSTSHTVYVDQQRIKNAESVFILSVALSPAWQTTRVTRTDVNGTDVPVRNPNHLEPSGTGTLTLTDYENALTGLLTYTVSDGVGGTAPCTITPNAYQSNRATNPIAVGVPDTTGWSGQSATLSDTGDQIRATTTNGQPDDLFQRMALPSTTGAVSLGEYEPGDAFRARAEARCLLTPSPPSPPTVVTRITGTQGNIASTDSSLVVTRGDSLDSGRAVLVVHLSGTSLGGSSNGIVSVSGCGATWAQLVPDNKQGATHTSSWWIGTGPTSAGAITVTLPGAFDGILRAWHLIGLRSNEVSRTEAHANSGAASLTGTPANAHVGQIVIQSFHWDVSSGTPNAAQSPVTWNNGTLFQNGVSGSRNTGFRTTLSPTNEAHNAVLTPPSGSAIMHVENLVLGRSGAAPTPVQQLRSRLTWLDDLLATVGTVEGPTVVCNASTFTEIGIDTAVPLGATGLRYEVGIAGTVDRSLSDWFEVRRVLLGRPGAYFDGDSPTAGGLSYAWSGTPDASASLEIVTASVTADQSAWLTLPVTALLASNLDPPDFAPMTFALDYDETTASAGTVHTILGRSTKLSNPAPMLARTGTLTLFCEDYTMARAVRELLKSPNTALFRQATYPGMDLYLAARSVRIGPEAATPTRRWTVQIAYDEVPRPS